MRVVVVMRAACMLSFKWFVVSGRDTPGRREAGAVSYAGSLESSGGLAGDGRFPEIDCRVVGERHGSFHRFAVADCEKPRRVKGVGLLYGLEHRRFPR